MVKGHTNVDWAIIVWQAGTIHQDCKMSIGISVVEVKAVVVEVKAVVVVFTVLSFSHHFLVDQKFLHLKPASMSSVSSVTWLVVDHPHRNPSCLGGSCGSITGLSLESSKHSRSFNGTHNREIGQ